MDDATHTDRIILDPNTLSEDGTIALTAVQVSWNGVWLTYGTGVSGSDWRTWHVRNIASVEDTNDGLTQPLLSWYRKARFFHAIDSAQFRCYSPGARRIWSG